MKSTNITQILTAIIAIIPPTLAILLPILTDTVKSIRKPQLNKILPLLEEVSLDILHISREKLTNSEWKSIKNSYRKRIIKYLFLTLILLVTSMTLLDLIIFSPSFSTSSEEQLSSPFITTPLISNLLGIKLTNSTTTLLPLHPFNIFVLICSLVIFILALITYYNTSKTILEHISLISNSIEQIRYFIFKEVKIIIKADPEKLPNCIQLALTSMKAEVIEINQNEKTIEANFGSIKSSLIIKTKIENKSQDEHLLIISYSGNAITCSTTINNLIKIITFNSKQKKTLEIPEKPIQRQKQTLLKRLLKIASTP